MEKDKAKELTDEIESIIEKYGAKNFSFCGELDNRFIGVINTNHNSLGSYFESVVNIGRLYQSAREKTKTILDKFNK